ncbi:MAG: outer membrane lipoprotein carrier protein LolA [Deltaproteobacteria bacterium]|nr:outer membrane lipoprotein carrier protein LolA [Deltaproteobacteria bacterium]
MSRAFSVTCLLLFLLQGHVQAAGELSNILEGIRKNHANLPGLTLSYEREVITRTMAMLGDQAKGDLATGLMYFKQPYYLKLAQKTPKPETVIANEDTLWWYIPDKKRVYEYSALEFGKELRLLSDIFRGLIQVEKRFQVTLLEPSELGENQIELIPNPPLQNIERIILTVTKEHDIRVVGIRYQLGSMTLFTLKNVTEKKDFEKDFFNFIVPEGVQLVKEKSSLP